jgi:hypothetical protein
MTVMNRGSTGTGYFLNIQIANNCENITRTDANDAITNSIVQRPSWEVYIY